MQLAQKFIFWSFSILFFFTPLFFWPDNSELFEFNKMRMVYGLTVVITTAWIVRMIQEKRFVFKQAPLDIPILLFFASQVISTIISIDVHTSIWGYYSRSNGGLLSLISYLLLYYAFVSNIGKEQLGRLLKALVFGGTAVSLYAIPEHFGASPSCLLLIHELNASCWVQDVQARVFATLGQPNWLAAYLGMVFFPAVYLFLTATKERKWIYFASSLLIYMAFTFTYSRGGMLGMVGGLGVFILGYIWLKVRHAELGSASHSVKLKNKHGILKQVQDDISSGKLNLLFYTIAGILTINLLFGSALTGGFRLIKQSAPPARPGIVQSGTQLENGGTESGQIRLIVWKGALEVFKHYPLFGSGVETFAYSYYQYRPVEHNNVSEWDFLYNKAHNEYLNYLATTGAVGFLTYLLMIGAFCLACIKLILKRSEDKHIQLLTLAVLAGYVSYLIQNIFGFSVVIIAVYFFLFPALVFVFAEKVKEPQKELIKMLAVLSPITKNIYKRNAYQKAALTTVVIAGLWILLGVYSNWEADTYYKRGNDLTDSGYVGEGFNNFVQAIDLHPTEPLYRAELGFAAAASAVSRYESATESAEEASEAAKIQKIAVGQTELALKISPKNTSLWRTAIRTYYQLSSVDPSFNEKTLEVLDKTIALAPTDPKLVFNKGLILASQNRLPEAIETLKKAVQLKPDYRDAIVTLADFYYRNKQKEEALGLIDELLEKAPKDQDLLQRKEQFSK